MSLETMDVNQINGIDLFSPLASQTGNSFNSISVARDSWRGIVLHFDNVAIV